MSEGKSMCSGCFGTGEMRIHGGTCRCMVCDGTGVVPTQYPEGIEKLVCNDIAERQKLGLNKYGVSVVDNPGDLEYWLTHAYQETLDNAVYLRRAIEEIRKQKAADDSWVERPVDVVSAAERIQREHDLTGPLSIPRLIEIINGCRR